MEAISSYFVLFIVFVWKTIKECFLWHCLMECCIKYTYHRYVWHQFFTCIDTDQVCRVVKWCKVIALFDCF